MKVPANFTNLSEIKKLFPKEMGVVGVGVTAYPRSALGYLLPNYTILSLLETADLEAVRQVCPVVSVEKDLGGVLPEKFNTSSILGLPKVREWFSRSRRASCSSSGAGRALARDVLLSAKPNNLFVYKDSEAIDRVAGEMGLKILGTAGKIRKVFENKKQFREELVKAGLTAIQGRTLTVDEVDEKKWEELRVELGEKLVFQLPDYTVGGGLGTFFINTKTDLREFKEFVERRRIVRKELDKVIEWVNVTKFIEGESSSILGCATRYGTVIGGLQKQIIDQPELAALQGRSGVWLGHDWNVKFDKEAQQQAERLCQQWGNYLYSQGYKGIFGLDVVVDKNNQVHLVECNARYTGAFPVYTMMQLDKGEIPLDVWHLLEWLGVDYEMDLDKVQALSRGEKQGAQLLLHNLERKIVTPTKTVKAGVYEFIARQDKLDPATRNFTCSSSGAGRGLARAKFVLPVSIKYVRPGFSLLDMKSENEFVLCDRIVGEEAVLKPAERLGRLVFKRRVMGEDNRLLPEIREVVKQVYNSFELMPVELED